ncbi:MAG: hypothetical protein PQJ59_16515 [Spirochaetales bacterium]|nr:hypothetical protein [Spirochaetales bacterium]
MIIAVSKIPVVEEILVTYLEKYLNDSVQWNSLYPNHTVRISNEHPWVPYMTSESLATEGWLDLNNVSESLFPAITVVNSQDSDDPLYLDNYTEQRLHKDEYDDFVTMLEDEAIYIEPTALETIQTHFESNEYLVGTRFFCERKDIINIDITVDDASNVKNRLYDLITIYLKGHGRKELFQDERIEILSKTVSGTRSGVYNIDFGRTLRGSTIQCEVHSQFWQVFYDTDYGTISEVDIDHTVRTNDE